MSLSPEQKELRRDRVGASEIGAILDLYRPEGAPRIDPYKDALEVFTEKVTGVEVEPEAKEHQLWGLDLEPAIIAYHARESGYALVPPPEGRPTWPSITHPKLPLITTPDAIAQAVEGLVGIQAKNDQGWSELEWGDPGTNSAPQLYVSQTTIEIGVLRANGFEIVRDEVAVTRRGAVPVAYPIPFDEELYGILCDYAAAFVRDYLIPRRPPPGTPKSEAEYVRRRYPKQTTGGLAPTPELQAAVQLVKTLRKSKKALLDELLVAETALKKAIGDAEGIAGLCTWKLEGKFTTYTVSKKPTRVLRIAGMRED